MGGPTRFLREGSVRIADIAGVQWNPAEFIGAADASGLHELFWEPIANVIHEHSIGTLNHVYIELFADGGCRVQDDGPGIPLKQGETTIEAFLTSLGRGSWGRQPWSFREGRRFLFGLRVVNALSQCFRLEIARDGRRWLLEFERGSITKPLTAIGETQESGTTINFWPDAAIFTSQPAFDLETILDRLTGVAIHHPGLRFVVRDHRHIPVLQPEICYPHGLTQRVQTLNQARSPVHPTVFHCQAKGHDREVEIALQWTMADTEIVHFYHNSLPCPPCGFQKALRRVFRLFGGDTGIVDPKAFTPERVRAGMTMIISAKSEVDRDVQALVETALNKHLTEFLYKNPEEADAICGGMMMRAQ